MIAIVANCTLKSPKATTTVERQQLPLERRGSGDRDAASVSAARRFDGTVSGAGSPLCGQSKGINRRRFTNTASVQISYKVVIGFSASLRLRCGLRVPIVEADRTGSRHLI